jgi:iron complex outermembrane receptor protein
MRGVALAAALAAPLGLAAQAGTIVGAVRDTAGRPLAGAVVVITGLARSAVADGDGRYRLAPVPPGMHAVLARALGHRPRLDSVRVAPGDTAALNFALVPSAIEVAPVVVAAAKRSQLTAEAVTSVAVVEQADIARRAVNTVDEALARAPGAYVLDGQINLRGSTGYSRGLGSRVLLLVDGVPANQGDRGGIAWDLLPIDQIERAELVKGAGSALYGSAALGGIVNLVTRDLPTGLHWRLRATGGVFADPPHEVWAFREGSGVEGGLDAAASYGTDRLRGRLAAGARHSDGYVEQDAADHWQMAGRGQWFAPSGRTALDVSGAWAVHHYEVPLVWCVTGQCDDRGQAYQPFKIDTAVRGDFTDSRKGYLHAVLEHAPSERVTGTMRGSWLRTHFTDSHRSGDDFSVANRVGAELRAQVRPAPRRTVTVGIEGALADVWSDIFSGSDSLDVAGTHTQGEYAAYGESEMHAGPARVTVGARADFLTVDGGGATAVVSPRLGVVLPTARGAWRASAGRGFRAPALAERFPTTVVGPFRVVPNPALRSETAWSVEAGFGGLAGGIVLLDAALFWTEGEDYIEPSVDPTLLVVQFRNVTRARLRGLDAAAATALWDGRLRVTLAYLFLDARQLAHDTVPERPLNFRPRHVLTLGTDYRVTRAVTVGGDFRYLSRFDRVDLFPSDERVPTSVVDLRAGWSTGPFALQARLTNAFDYIYNQVPRTLEPVRSLAVVATWTR